MRIRRFTIVFFISYLIVTVAFGQQRGCSTMEYLEFLRLITPNLNQSLQNIENQTTNVLAVGLSVDGPITIPVVVHVVYNANSENISQAQIESQLVVLNEDFRRLNDDANDIWPQAADSEIEFCLASVDPDGNPTSGITRTFTTTTSFSTDNRMKFSSSGGKDAWPTNKYLNIWVCNISGNILGYAQFPGGGASTDGVVVDYQAFGTTGAAAYPFNMGRTTTHEVGHWLNLRHIWGDGDCSVDDLVDDTPVAGAPNYTGSPCNFPGPNTCASTSNDDPDMFQNYMDYSNDECMNLFTSGQKMRMRALFEPGGFRAGLLSSGGCGSGNNPTPTCSDGIQNGNETGVDCGGSCAPCPCNGTTVDLTLKLDNYPEETSWTLTSVATGNVVASGGTYRNVPDGSTNTAQFCLPNSCYNFRINDSYGDGICCNYGSGFYRLKDDKGNTLASGGSFRSSETTNFCLTASNTPTCNDGIQNGGETGIDCGGSCAPCPTCNDGIQNGDETGIDCGGSCTPCPTCNDGIQNGGETGIDCGGPCAPCPTCNDGIQNGDETGIDCGGSCTPCPTCNDGIQNGGETGIDCGGSCAPCPTCNDGIQNGDETGIDCGGSCAPCPTCNDGIQNGGETGIDCGGSCPPCDNTCNGTTVRLTIKFDNYPEETSWTLTAVSTNQVVASGGTYGNAADGSTIMEEFCLPNGCYNFRINDAYGDGICCSYGSGFYSLVDGNGNTLASGSNFGSSQTTNFCLSGPSTPTCDDGVQNGGETGVDCGGTCTPCPTCNDGIQNGDETGIDCGGSCSPCSSTCTFQLINFENFETGLGIWRSGGSDGARSITSANFANGLFAMRIRDNSSTSYFVTTAQSLAQYNTLKISFSYIVTGFDNAGEDFFLQISQNGGNTYTTVEEWNLNNEFVNNIRYNEVVTITGSFTNNTRIRFLCDASDDSDVVYIDDIRIEGCTGTVANTVLSQNIGADIPAITDIQLQQELENGIAFDMTYFPNPASASLNVRIINPLEDETEIELLDVSGRVVLRNVLTTRENQNELRLDIGHIEPGFYLMRAKSGTVQMVKKLIISRD